MDTTVLATTLHHLGTGKLSDAVTRAVNQRRLSPVPLRVRVQVRETSYRRRRMTSGALADVTMSGMNAWMLDANTAVALARGGILIRDEATGDFFIPTVERLAAERNSTLLGDYLAQAEELIAQSSAGASAFSLRAAG